ncbi:outer membrane protein assembly factor BamD [Salinibacillus xinjiangensis]|uniref:Uncharacterized protein n=1 Tax=Salinibacillus xinjiangensis TaxID=1229268 RepID=A0A6G1X519_9BACI|nr:hypothetical protein [Salinibacillus xinjiangensis]MRG85996.1 hypothetical protein [Salinibacillus xinjiangensis]
MKKLPIIFLTLTLSFVLFGCNKVQESQDKAQTEGKSLAVKGQYEQKIIIMDSVDESLPPEAKNVQSMPSKSEPQQIPNVNLDDPIVITKMHYSETEKPQ